MPLLVLPNQPTTQSTPDPSIQTVGLRSDVQEVSPAAPVVTASSIRSGSREELLIGTLRRRAATPCPDPASPVSRLHRRPTGPGPRCHKPEAPRLPLFMFPRARRRPSRSSPGTPMAPEGHLDALLLRQQPPAGSHGAKHLPCPASSLVASTPF